MNPSKGDYKILESFSKTKSTTEMKSLTIKQIQEITGYSINKVRDAIKILLLLQYIQEGAVQHSAKTYYLTKSGQSKLHELFPDESKNIKSGEWY